MIILNTKLPRVFVSMIKRLLFLGGKSLIFSLLFTSQLFAKNPKLKSNYNLISYDISVKVQPEIKSIEGANTIQISALNSLNMIELDLFPQIKVSAVSYLGSNIRFVRDSNSFIVHFPSTIKKNDTIAFTIFFSGKPIIAQKAPWDGGFVWGKDSSGFDWVGLACEGVGPSCWLPCKDVWNDEPERMKMKLIVPKGLVGVSNGRFLGSKNRLDGYAEFDWQVLSPINQYNISINIGNYEHIEDIYVNAKNERLSLDYYVLPQNVSKAKTHFQQVKRMLQTFEFYFGPYPFYQDGYKLVETPYWGMEHQSCVAYGNNYINNNYGFDFIIIHESGHEWFANSITASDKADMWIHEGFTTYSEALYVEKQYGKFRAVQYLKTQRENIKNNKPIIGQRGVNFNRPDNDNYYKGTWILHTMRSILDNDTLWFNTLKDLNKEFYHKIVNSKQIENYFIRRTGYNFRPFFDQYLYHAAIPVIEYYIVQKNGLNELHYHLKTDVNSLELPAKVTLTKGGFDYLSFERKWKIYDLPYSDENEFKLDEGNFLIGMKKYNPKESDKK